LYRPLTELWEDAAKGTLPSYAWINPRSAVNITTMQGSSDQHPDHDVALGEAIMKDIYEALRASPQWNETLLIITRVTILYNTLPKLPLIYG
jgi:phospholipase C